MWVSQGPQQEQLWLVPASPSPPAQTFQLEWLCTIDIQGLEQPTPEETPMGPRLQALQRQLQQGAQTSLGCGLVALLAPQHGPDARMRQCQRVQP